MRPERRESGTISLPPATAGCCAASASETAATVEQLGTLLDDPGALRTVYQPVVELRTGHTAGYEALTRVAQWPARSPVPWFRAAAENGLAGPFEALALTNCLRARSELPADQFLAVNLDPLLLAEPAVREVFADHPDLHGVVLELTGLARVPPLSPAGQALVTLRDRGALVAADVVHGGLEELERLVELRPDMVTVDGGLIAEVSTEPVRDQLLRLILGLAEDAGAVVLAEGVEDQTTARHLQSLGVSLAQGWLFGRARPGFLPPPADSAGWLSASWQETVRRTRVARLAVPLPPVGLPVAPGEPDPEWRAEHDRDRRFVALITPRGRRLSAAEVPRVKAELSPIAAARRALEHPDLGHGSPGVVAVVDDRGALIGIVGVEVLLRTAFLPPPEPEAAVDDATAPPTSDPLADPPPDPPHPRRPTTAADRATAPS